MPFSSSWEASTRRAEPGNGSVRRVHAEASRKTEARHLVGPRVSGSCLDDRRSRRVEARHLTDDPGPVPELDEPDEVHRDVMRGSSEGCCALPRQAGRDSGELNCLWWPSSVREKPVRVRVLICLDGRQPAIDSSAIHSGRFRILCSGRTEARQRHQDGALAHQDHTLLEREVRQVDLLGPVVDRPAVCLLVFAVTSRSSVTYPTFAIAQGHAFASTIVSDEPLGPDPSIRTVWLLDHWGKSLS